MDLYVESGAFIFSHIKDYCLCSLFANLTIGKHAAFEINAIEVLFRRTNLEQNNKDTILV